MISSQMKIWGAVLTIAALVGGGLYITRWKSEGASVINLGLEDNGKTINVSVGDKIIVKLGESGSTGYIWEYTVDENFTKVIKDERIHSKENIVGGGCLRVIEFKVINSGKGKIIMNLGRPWENQPIKRFSVTLTAK